ncbi:hypothetical protein [Chryseobacterium oncorhynchi]|uniref:Glycosyltransferase RgtA/B/C/D-like domain-containing protein n=1 Tax=Chryseobacterium oncorhynchi TaxID=741074 RepID=A0A316X3D8_9FLAO|nr:hypothetical protein [Chryseobacterium oncorhynchi]PWN67809.1 hypothetical protein C1638_004220 [Chryseobacterium oncorhynchi]
MPKYLKEVIITLVVVFSRLPFIFNSLGSDLDAWREVYTGKVWHEEHIYNVSRFPGYPFSEFIYSLIYDCPYWCINLLSVLFTVGCCLFFFRILEFFKIKLSFLISLVLSFTPIIYINSTVAMEYNWSLFFLLASVYSILNKKLWAASIFFGLIVSTRFNNIIFLPAFLFLTYCYIGKDIKKILQFSILSILFTFIFFLPVILKYGTHFLQSSGASEVSYPTLVSLGTLHVYGTLGILAIFLALVIQLFKGSFQKVKNLYRDHFMLFCIIMILSNLIFFLKYPLEAGYLIPSVPFLLILLQNVLEPKLMKIVLYGFLISPFFIHINTNKVNLKGIVFVNEGYEDQELEYCQNLIKKIETLSNNTPGIFHVGNFSEQILLMGNFSKNNTINIVKNLTQKDKEDIVSKKRPLYYINTVDGKIENDKNHMLKQHGILFYKDFELVK